MFTDKLLRVSEDQALQMNATTALSSNSIDLSVARDIGEGKELFFNFAITEAIPQTTASLVFEIVIADNAALDSNLVVLIQTPAIAYTALTLGTNVVVPIPPKVGSLGKRYLGVRYTTGGNATGLTGKVTADVVETIQDGKKFYPSGIASLVP